MKTIVSFHHTDEAFPSYAIFDGDYSYLEGTIVGVVGNEENQDKLMELLFWDDEVGDYRYPMQSTFPMDLVKMEDCIVIHCAFIA